MSSPPAQYNDKPRFVKAILGYYSIMGKARTMSDLETLADLFQREVSDGDVFGKISYTEEAERLRMLAGKLHYKAEKDPDRIRSDKLKDIAKVILTASEMLKRA